ncbi:MAG TPA: 16S rRNA (uracil(1498)-N(3))-methyltransferase, partial [Bacteroidales bacterium]|nr:16S rRNA (uracil(1498)-N(3))-methyltransferase [Bacteroidales bacterium]
MQLFYVTGISGGACILGDEESHHCLKVLRMREGDTLHLTDGEGHIYEGALTGMHPKGCLVTISSTKEVPPDPCPIHIAIAPTKNIDRFEWFLEKATEIGISEITPLICEHSEREVVKLPRLEKVIVSAMKQSLKAWLPKLREPVRFRDLVVRQFPGGKFIAYCETGRESLLQKVCAACTQTLVLIGPEGDFSPAEVSLAIQQGFTPVSLGPSRLRTETAGIVA